jgi:hypothetical protein
MVDAGLYVMYVLFAVAIVAALGLPVISAIKSPANVVKSLIGIGAMVVLFFVSYGISGGDVTAKQAALGVTETTSKMVGAGLTMFYIVMVTAVIGLIYSEINKAFK